MTVQIFSHAVTQRQRVVPEELVEHRDIVAHERRLVTLERGGDFGHDVRQIDFKCRFCAHTGIMHQPTIARTCSGANSSSRAPCATKSASMRLGSIGFSAAACGANYNATQARTFSLSMFL